MDNCGTCDEDSANNCSQDCANVWGGTSCVSDCGCVSIDNSGDDCDDCAGVPNGDAEIFTYWYDGDNDGLGAGESSQFCNATVEEGWVLNGDDLDDNCTSNIIDCAGECGGTALEDECGICNGTGIPDGECDCNGNVDDCAGECGGCALEDEGGIGNGTGIDDGEGDCNGNVDECAGEGGGWAVYTEGGG